MIDIPGFEGYYRITEDGRVYSLISNKFLRPHTASAGYPQFTLCIKTQRHQVSLHRIMALAFYGEPKGRVVRHLDGNPLNNVLSNLAYGTVSENGYDSVEHGTHHQVNKTHCPRGHEYNDLNTYIDTKHHRRCRVCKRILDTGYRKAKSGSQR